MREAKPKSFRLKSCGSHFSGGIVAVVLNRVSVVPQGTFGNIWAHIWLSQLGGCCWHLEGRDQECCLNILQYTVQFPRTKNSVATDVNSAKKG